MITCKRLKNRRAITALPNTETGFIAESSCITESNLIETPLPAALYKRGIAKCFPLYLFSVVHHLDFVE